MLFHQIGWLPLICARRRVSSAASEGTRARTHGRMEGGKTGERRKNRREEEKQRRFEEAFVPTREEQAALVVAVQAVLREKRTTSKLTLAAFVPDCTYEGSSRASVLCK